MFVSEDPYGGRLGDPMSLNRYAYARDNPMTLVDPSGKVYTDEQAYGDTNACTTADCSLTQAQMDANNEAMVGETMYDPVGTTTDLTDVSKVSYTPSRVSSSSTTGTTSGSSAPQASPENALGAIAVVGAGLAATAVAFQVGVGLASQNLNWVGAEALASGGAILPDVAGAVAPVAIAAVPAFATGHTIGYLIANWPNVSYGGAVDAFGKGIGIATNFLSQYYP